jgi:asparagine synthase (glutamine-hydrolysing)
MSVQFGRWSFEPVPLPLGFLEKVDSLLLPYAPDSSNSYHEDGVSILYRAFHITRESRRDTQPLITGSGTVLTWDGRLDNRDELIHRFGGLHSADLTDVSIVSLAFERAGTACFRYLLGDWALAVWDPRDRSLVLAKDPMGTRHLYYSLENDHVSWSSVLDPLVLMRTGTFTLDEEYLAGWFAMFPAAHLTPYMGIDSVPPSCFARIARGRRTVTKYWDFDPGQKIHYRTDREYEEHFRIVFRQAVARRLRSDRPILAELSGGMDSSSIVCTADQILAQASAEAPLLDTVSYYNDSEPNWDERPYLATVEEKRGRAGWHIDVSRPPEFGFDRETAGFAATPAASDTSVSTASRQLASCLTSQGNRVLLSGIGGDEFMGGVPTPIPELMDLEARARLKSLARQLKLWALEKRTPWFYLFFEAARGFFPATLVGVPKRSRPPTWLEPGFIRRQWLALTGYPSRVKLLGPLPSFQENMFTVDVLRRQLACSALSTNPPYQKCYPFLDRTLLEFICAIPREQLVRPGQRRSLMRRALVGIVPEDILHRRRKGFVARSPLVALSAQTSGLIAMTRSMATSALGIVDGKAFAGVLEGVRHGQQVGIAHVMRTLWIESWLRTIAHKKIVALESRTENVLSSQSSSAKSSAS